MQTLKLRDQFYWTGIVDRDLRVFDIIMFTEFGTTYNSYVLKAGDKTILFETAKAKFFEDYLDELKEITEIGSIDYLVVDHTEPDHAGSVEHLLALNPNMKIIATSCAINFLKNIVNRDFYSIPVRDNETITIGDRTLRFLTVPHLHWPDTMYTYIEEERILITCDSFGAHYGVEGILRSGVEREADYRKALKYYFDCIMGPFKPYMLKAVKRVRELRVDLICTGHGPVLDEKISEVLDLYEKWCTVVNPNKNKTVIIPYVSAYGYTEQLAGEIVKGIKASGPVEVRSYDLVEADLSAVVQEIEFADGVLFGTPTIVGEALKPIWDLTTSLYPSTHGGKYAGAFGSYGWSGEGVPHIVERLKQLKMKVMDEGFRVRFKPGEVDLMEAYEYGYQFGRLVQEKTDSGKKKEKTGARKLVKCLVCGEIFDSSLDTCPVCGVGREYFVDVEVEETTFRKDTGDFFVILGNGAAGLSAAEAIRERNATASIVMISEEPFDTYNRPMLTKSMMAGLSPEQIAVHDRRWYEEKNIIRVLDRRVTAIDRGERQVELSDGTRIFYTKLIYALGAESLVPPIKGAKRERVATVRRLADVQELNRLLPTVRKVAVIGGGVLGLETAWEFKKSKCEVTVIEAAPRLMPRQLDEAGAKLLKKIAVSEEIAVMTGARVAEIAGDGVEGAVTGVLLEDGSRIPADLVILSAGIRPNTELAKKAGIEADRAVIVNERMETSAEHIYACGDCAQYRGMDYGIWPVAVDQGKTAGANAAGEERHYEVPSLGVAFHGMNTALFSVGDIGTREELSYRTVEVKDEAKRQYEKYYYSNKQLCGAILIGDLSRMAKIAEEVSSEK